MNLSSKPKRTKVFISYSHKDREWLKRLQVHLKPLEREGIVNLWADTGITTGEKWREEIKQAIDEAKVAVLLISPEFLASDYIANVELPLLLAAAEKEGLVIMSVIISPSSFSDTESLSLFQLVNDPSKPLVDLNRGGRDRVWVKLTREIEMALKETGASIKETGASSAPEEAKGTHPKLLIDLFRMFSGSGVFSSTPVMSIYTKKIIYEHLQIPLIALTVLMMATTILSSIAAAARGSVLFSFPMLLVFIAGFLGFRIAILWHRLEDKIEGSHNG